MANWEKFNRTIDKKLLEDAKQGGQDFEDVPNGTYEVAIESMNPTESKSGRPMVTTIFKIVEGKQKNRKIWYHQLVENDTQIGIFIRFLRSLKTGVEVHPKNLVELAELTDEVFNEMKGQRLEYALEYGETNKGFKTYKITSVFEPQ